MGDDITFCHCLSKKKARGPCLEGGRVVGELAEEQVEMSKV
jgi:hypothetical protein